MGVVELTGDEGPKEIIAIAYGMEEGLAAFYTEMARRGEGEGLTETLLKLAKVEEIHKERLIEVYAAATGESVTRDAFEKETASGMLEGGFTTDDFLKENEEMLKTVEGLLEVAMMLEAQALDLYMRYSQKVAGPGARDILFKIADDEKVHLKYLGELMDERV